MRTRQVTSLANPAVRAARALRLRKGRAESGLFLAEGLRIIGEALAAGRAPRVLLHGPNAGEHPILRRAIAAAGETLEVTAAILAKISRRDNPQTVIGVFEEAFTPLSALDPASASCWIALEGVRDPGNLGTIIRTADAAALGGVILVGECCDPYSVEAVRATMGSIFAVNIARASRESFLARLRAWPGSVAGASLAGATDFRAFAWPPPALIVMGAEQAGLSPELAAACEALVKIPMRGRADSLNLAVAAGILIYQAVA
ncbi:MAG: TrmH family RNA methyltransferase [Caulobacteraceae bacterium]